MLILIYSTILTFSLFLNEKKASEEIGKRYVKLNTGLSNLNLNAQDKTLSYSGRTYNSNYSFALNTKLNHFLGPSIKGITGDKINFVTVGLNYSYLYFFENKSLLGFHLFLGGGNLKYERNFSQGFYTPTNYFIQKVIFDNIFTQSSGVVFLQADYGYGGINNFNFTQVTPSISYEYPIFENGYYLAGEIFYSYKKFSQKNKIPYYDTILLNGNEIGFQVGVSRRL